MKSKKFCVLLYISILISKAVVAEVYIDGQLARPINPNHDEMMRRAAFCGAYHIRTEGNVDVEKMKNIQKVLNDYGVTKNEYNAAVISNLEHLGKLESGEIQSQYGQQPPTIDKTLNNWKSQCRSVELYQELSR